LKNTTIHEKNEQRKTMGTKSNQSIH